MILTALSSFSCTGFGVKCTHFAHFIINIGKNSSLSLHSYYSELQDIKEMFIVDNTLQIVIYLFFPYVKDFLSTS